MTTACDRQRDAVFADEPQRIASRRQTDRRDERAQPEVLSP